MRARNPIEPDAAEPDDVGPVQPQQRRKREAIAEFEKLGALYAVLNYLAPLVRLFAIGNFLFGSTEYNTLLGVVMAGIVTGMSRPVLFKLSGHIATALFQDGGDPELSSRFHQLRLVWSQGMRVALLCVLYAVAVLVCDPRPYLGPTLASGALSLPPTGAVSEQDDGAGSSAAAAPHPYTAAQLTGCGAAVAALFCVVWSLVHRLAPRERLTMADGTHDLTSASEDELLLQMPPGYRLVSLSLRLISVALEAVSDSLLVFVFLPSRLEALARPSAMRPPPVWPALIAASIAYGSQHLRFRNEWLLCAMYGLGLVALAHELGGEMLPVFIAAMLFAAFRHLRRTGLDVRRFHAQ